MANDIVRKALKEKKMKQWELAEMLGISEQTFCRRMRKELPEAEQERIIKLIQNCHNMR